MALQGVMDKSQLGMVIDDVGMQNKIKLLKDPYPPPPVIP
jgi:hypothetical protein